MYKLKGIIYFGGAHFTSRVINQSGELWYHDGIATGRNCIYNGKVREIQNHELLNVQSRQGLHFNLHADMRI